MRNLYVIGSLYLAVAAYALVRGPATRASEHSSAAGAVPDHSSAAPDDGSDAGTWFRAVKPRCNSLEVETVHRREPPPATMEGAGYSAACYALAGRIDRSREIILALTGDDRWKAAGIVFNIGHPIADMGDDRSAGPIMELVVEVWPNHYQALYHAGASSHALGRFDRAREYLEEFLRYYNQDDFFTRNAKRLLGEMGDR